MSASNTYRSTGGSVFSGSISLKSLEGSKLCSHPMDHLYDIDVGSPKHVTIRDHYLASGGSDEKQLNYQRGLSNYSNVILGDDRIAFTKSMTACLHEVQLPSPERQSQEKYKSTNVRRKEYAESISSVGGNEAVDHIQEIIKLKLDQRKKFGMFQLRKNFKYYDRANTGFVDVIEFSRSLELMGFQFNEQQLVALFARYDPECRGSINYSDVLNTFSSTSFVPRATGMSSPDANSYRKSEAITDDELLEIQRIEMSHAFNSVDHENKGYITPNQAIELMATLGEDVTPSFIPRLLKEMNISTNGEIDLELWMHWWSNRSYK
eukprot:gene11755-24651_t